VDKEKAIVLFDGMCNFCSGSALFIIKRDPERYFRFAALQTDPGKLILKEYDIETEKFNSLILIEKGKVYFRSDAALRIARRLSGGWPVFYAFVIVPPFIRNFFYDLLAGNRYRWFGKRKTCFIPDQHIRNRFIS
jgi:predicted DCC family thiol-disulfide oxidoreductase YuxK